MKTTQEQWLGIARVLGDWSAGCEAEDVNSEVYMTNSEFGFCVTVTAFFGDREVGGQGVARDPVLAARSAVDNFTRERGTL